MKSMERTGSCRAWRGCSIRIPGTALQRAAPILSGSDRSETESCAARPAPQPKAGRRARWASRKWWRSRTRCRRPQESRTVSWGGPRGACKPAPSLCPWTEVFWGLCRCLHLKRQKTLREKKTLWVRGFVSVPCISVSVSITTGLTFCRQRAIDRKVDDFVCFQLWGGHW